MPKKTQQKKKSDLEGQDTAMVVGQEGAPVSVEPAKIANLIELAINKDLDIEKMKMLVEMQERERARVAEQNFLYHFTEMQKEYVPVAKRKHVKSERGDLIYAYCPLPDILLVYGPILAKHGFSYSWGETPLKETGEKRTTIFITGYGHTKTSSIDLPIADENKYANGLQARGITREYGRRYTFMDATGCIVADEDGSGKMPPADPEATRKQVASFIPLVPEYLRAGYKEKLEKATNKDLHYLWVETKALKEKCQKLIREAESRSGVPARELIIRALKIVTNNSEFEGWVDYAANI